MNPHNKHTIQKMSGVICKYCHRMWVEDHRCKGLKVAELTDLRNRVTILEGALKALRKLWGEHDPGLEMEIINRALNNEAISKSFQKRIKIQTENKE